MRKERHTMTDHRYKKGRKTGLWKFYCTISSPGSVAYSDWPRSLFGEWAIDTGCWKDPVIDIPVQHQMLPVEWEEPFSSDQNSGGLRKQVPGIVHYRWHRSLPVCWQIPGQQEREKTVQHAGY